MQLIKLGLEFGPLGVFFFVNAQLGIFHATAAFMVARDARPRRSYALFRKVAVMPLVTGAFVLVFGGLTLYLQDDTFIKIKPTVVNMSVRAYCWRAGWLLGKPILKVLLGEVLQMEDEGWRSLPFDGRAFSSFWPASMKWSGATSRAISGLDSRPLA